MPFKTLKIKIEYNYRNTEEVVNALHRKNIYHVRFIMKLYQIIIRQ